MTAASAAQADELPDLPLNRYQFIGTHNSYHVAPSEKLRRFIETMSPGQGEALNYTHRPIWEQLEKLGIRQIELDLYGDPTGGLYANPLSARLGGTPVTDPAWQEPGFKIFHSPDFDVNTTVVTFRRALKELRAWSNDHPQHEPVLVLLELKSDSFSAMKPPPFDKAALLALEAEIRAELEPQRLLTPDDVRGNFGTLRAAVSERGWPRLSKTRGKFIFALDNEDLVRDEYLALSPQQDLRERLCFVSVPPDHDAAAWVKHNDPIAKQRDIRALVVAGFMVRTRADADMKEVLANDQTRLKAALDSGAQWISTDAPEPDPRSPDYKVAWPDNSALRLNPVIADIPN